jgi:hypothetical protein
LAIGRFLPLRAFNNLGVAWILVLLIVIALLLRYWPAIVSSIERWWRAR